MRTPPLAFWLAIATPMSCVTTTITTSTITYCYYFPHSSLTMRENPPLAFWLAIATAACSCSDDAEARGLTNPKPSPLRDTCRSDAVPLLPGLLLLLLPMLPPPPIVLPP